MIWALLCLLFFSTPPQQPAPAATASARVWEGRAAEYEAYLRTAPIVKMTAVDLGVTHPKRAFFAPDGLAASAAWKPLRPGFQNGYWESYKSEIAAYHLDRLLELRMVPPAVEREVRGDMGAAIMWIDGSRSVKEEGGQVPSSVVWGPAVRRMVMFDNLIGNPDRNAGNILLGPPGEFILIDHSRAFVTDRDLKKFDRVDADLWDRITRVPADDLRRVLQPWVDGPAIAAVLARRDQMIATVDRLVKSRGRTAVIIP